MAFLVLEFAADKAHVIETQDMILEAIRGHNILYSETAPLENLGIFAGTRSIAMFRYKLRLSLLTKPSQQTIETLKRDLSEAEVYDVHLE